MYFNKSTQLQGPFLITVVINEKIAIDIKNVEYIALFLSLIIFNECPNINEVKITSGIIIITANRGPVIPTVAKKERYNKAVTAHPINSL